MERRATLHLGPLEVPLPIAAELGRLLSGKGQPTAAVQQALANLPNAAALAAQQRTDLFVKELGNTPAGAAVIRDVLVNKTAVDSLTAPQLETMLKAPHGHHYLPVVAAFAPEKFLRQLSSAVVRKELAPEEAEELLDTVRFIPGSEQLQNLLQLQQARTAPDAPELVGKHLNAMPAKDVAVLARGTRSPTDLLAALQRNDPGIALAAIRNPAATGEVLQLAVSQLTSGGKSVNMMVLASALSALTQNPNAPGALVAQAYGQAYTAVPTLPKSVIQSLLGTRKFPEAEIAVAQALVATKGRGAKTIDALVQGSTNPTVLSALVQADAGAAEKLAKRDAPLPPAVQLQLAATGTPGPQDAQGNITAYQKSTAQVELAKRPDTSAEALGKILEQLNDASVLITVAKHENCPPWFLHNIATCNLDSWREMAAKNLATNTEDLQLLAKDKRKEIAAAAKETLAYKHPSEGLTKDEMKAKGFKGDESFDHFAVRTDKKVPGYELGATGAPWVRYVYAVDKANEFPKALFSAMNRHLCPLGNGKFLGWIGGKWDASSKTLYATECQSDLLQNSGAGQDRNNTYHSTMKPFAHFRNKLDNRFSGWYYVFFNQALREAQARGAKYIAIPTAKLYKEKHDIGGMAQVYERVAKKYPNVLRKGWYFIPVDDPAVRKAMLALGIS